MEERLEWVQIIEPKSKDILYANLRTGECAWEVPSNAKIKPVDENQWWELFDINTKRHYYYNSRNQRTVWQRPLHADIIPLSKLQMIKDQIESIDEQTAMTAPISTIHHAHPQLLPANNSPMIVSTKWKQNSLQRLDEPSQEKKSKFSSVQRPIRRMATDFPSNTLAPPSVTNQRISSISTSRNKIEKAAFNSLNKSIHSSSNHSSSSNQTNDSSNNHPTILDQSFRSTEKHALDQRLENNHRKIPLVYNLKSSESTSNSYMSMKTSFGYLDPVSPKMFRQLSSSSLDFIHNHCINSMSLNRSHLARNNLRKKQPRTNPNYFQVQIPTDDGSIRSTYIRVTEPSQSQATTISSSMSNSSSEQDSILDCSQSFSNDSNGYFPSDETISTDKTQELTKDDLIHGRKTSKIKSKQMKNFQATASPAPRRAKEWISYTNGLGSSTSCATDSSPSTLPAGMTYEDHSHSYSLSNSFEPNSINRSEDVNSDESSSCLTRSTSIQPENYCYGKENHQQHIYHQVHSSIPTGKIDRKSALALIEIEPDLLNIHSHKRGLFSKRSIDNHLLLWSKEGITKPLLRTLDKALKREAPEIFKLIQIYMGDRKSRQIGSLQICLDLATKGWSLPMIRDELYLQLMKQTNENPNIDSLQRGWELIAICLSFFPPSIKFQGVLERYVTLQSNADSNTSDLPLTIYARVCQRRLEKILLTGPKKGLRKPTYEEIELSKHTIHFPSMFGTTLEEVMAMQRTRYPERSLPWIQTTLSEEVLRLNGTQIEGIFRVPGDLDNVNALKVRCDQWQTPTLEDAHLPASLLKLWYRELSEPLIPSMFYEQCIVNCDKVENCLYLVTKLPDINRRVLMYLIRFLQIFIAPENVMHTKMDVNNLSMVFAPNILRCNAEDAKTIFENARKEMSFVKVLILHLNTDCIDGVI